MALEVVEYFDAVFLAFDLLLDDDAGLTVGGGFETEGCIPDVVT